MHPIERLRYVARSADLPADSMVSEAAGALCAFAGDPTGLLTACRQLIRRRPRSAPLVWLAARMLTGPNPVVEANDVVESITSDPTSEELALALPKDCTALVIGCPDLISNALLRRPDVDVMVVDAAGEGYRLLHQLESRDHSCSDVPDWGVGTAVAHCDLVLLEAEAFGPDSAIARSGSAAALAVASMASIDIWLVAGVGRFLPMRMWQAMLDTPTDRDPWLLDTEVVSLERIDRVCGVSGPVRPIEAISAGDCPMAPELFR